MAEHPELHLYSAWLQGSCPASLRLQAGCCSHKGSTCEESDAITQHLACNREPLDSYANQATPGAAALKRPTFQDLLLLDGTPTTAFGASDSLKPGYKCCCLL